MSVTGKPSPVAQYQKDPDLLSPDESKPLYNKIKGNHLLLLYDESKQKTVRLEELDLLSRYEKIMTSPISLKIYKYLLKVGCASGPEIQAECKLAEASTYRCIDLLKNEGFINNVFTLRRKGVNGKRPLIYGIKNYSKDELDQAITRCLKQSTPIYDYIGPIVQLCLKDATDQIIQFRKIVNIANKYSNKGFNYMDLADETAKALHFKGIKVIK